MIEDKYYSLLKVNECGSFVGASKQLAVTQPAVSQHIKAIEQELNVKIFEREKGNLILTHQGNLVIQCARKMVGLENLLKQDLADTFTSKEHLTVGVTHTAESNPIAEALARYCAENEGISIKILTAPIKNLYKMLKSYELDLAIVEGRKTDEGLKYLMLDTDYLAIVLSPEHPLAKQGLVTVEELKRERLILRLPNSGTRNLLDAHLGSNNMSIHEFNVVLELDNVATIKDLVRQNFGVSILPKSVCLNELKKNKLVVLPVENLSMIREMNIAYREDFTQFDILQKIVNAYRSTVKNYM